MPTHTVILEMCSGEVPPAAKHISKITVCVGILRLQADGTTKMLLGFRIAAQLGKSRPEVVERLGITGIELEQPLIRSDRLGISALSQVFITLGKKMLGLAGAGLIRRPGSRITTRH